MDTFLRECLLLEAQIFTVVFRQNLAKHLKLLMICLIIILPRKKLMSFQNILLHEAQLLLGNTEYNVL